MTTLLLDTLKQNQFDLSSRSPATEAQYIARAKWAIRRALVLQFNLNKDQKKAAAQLTDAQLRAIPESLVVDQMLQQKNQGLWAHATWRQIKASLMFYYSQLLQDIETGGYLYEVNNVDPLSGTPFAALGPQVQADVAEYTLSRAESLREIIKSLAMVEGPTPEEIAHLPLRTSALRKKNFSAESFNTVLLVLKATAGKHKWNNLTITWLTLGALTGLRPHEWCQAEVVELPEVVETPDLEGTQQEIYTWYLKVLNSKNSNNRAHGEYRHIDISALSESERSVLADFCGFMKESLDDGYYQNVYKGCKEALRRANKAILSGNLNKFVKIANQVPTKAKGGKIYNNIKKTKDSLDTFKVIQLYSARHKAASDAKQVLTQAEVAAFMGHATDQTAAIHYGKRSHGGRGAGGLRVRPSAGEVAKVRKLPGANRAANMQAQAKRKLGRTGRGMS